MNQLKNNIKRLRKQHGFSQEYVAEQLDVSRQAVSKWETGQSEPSMGNLIKLAKLFEVEMSELVDQKTHERFEAQKEKNSQRSTSNTKMHLAAFFGHILVMVGYSGFSGLYTHDQSDALSKWYWILWYGFGLVFIFISSRDYYRKQKFSPLMYVGFLFFLFAVFALPSLLPFDRAWTAFISNMTAGATIIFLNLKFWRHRWSVKK